MSKYRLTDDVLNVDGGMKLYRIQNVDGYFGGFIEKESNLSQEGFCWVDEDAWVYGNARVYGDAQVYENAQVSGSAWICENARVYGDARVFEDAEAVSYTHLTLPTILLV